MHFSEIGYSELLGFNQALMMMCMCVCVYIYIYIYIYIIVCVSVYFSVGCLVI